MIFNIELPFSLNKARIGNRIRIQIRAYDIRIRIQEAKKKHGSGSIYFFSADILYHVSSDWGFRENSSRKVFTKNFREKLAKFRNFERSKKCFRPNPSSK
jgi:hypothetical protein